MSSHDAVRARFAATADRVAKHAAQQVDETRADVERLLALGGSERALDVGTGAGVLALALAPLVGEVVGLDLVPELLEAARRSAPGNVSFVEGDAVALPFAGDEFDLVGSRRTIHHIARPELAIAEMARVAKPGGLILVNDQIAPADPLVGLELDRFERTRDPSHTRSLPDTDFRSLFDSNGLVLERFEPRVHRRPLDYYLDLAGCEGANREHVRSLAPGGGDTYSIEIAWYVARKPSVT